MESTCFSRSGESVAKQRGKENLDQKMDQPLESTAVCVQRQRAPRGGVVGVLESTTGRRLRLRTSQTAKDKSNPGRWERRVAEDWTTDSCKFSVPRRRGGRVIQQEKTQEPS